MKKYAKIIDIKTKQVDVGLSDKPTEKTIKMWQKWGFTLLDVEQASTGDWYIKGNAPIPTYFKNEQNIRRQKEAIYRSMTDSYVLKYMRAKILQNLSKEDEEELCEMVSVADYMAQMAMKEKGLK